MRESVESMERNGRMTMGNRPCGRNAIFKCVAIIATGRDDVLLRRLRKRCGQWFHGRQIGGAIARKA